MAGATESGHRSAPGTNSLTGYRSPTVQVRRLWGDLRAALALTLCLEDGRVGLVSVTCGGSNNCRWSSTPAATPTTRSNVGDGAPNNISKLNMGVPGDILHRSK